jgi:hypothetical protein
MAVGKKKSAESPVAKIPRRIKSATPSPAKKGKNDPVLKVWAPPEPFYVELYIFEKNSNDDGFINGIREYLKGYGADGREECSAFDKANFTRLVPRREPNSNNRPLKTHAGYNRCILLRQLGDPSDPTVAVPSTTATRAQGLAALKEFLRDPRFSKYPVDNTLRLMDMNENTTTQACDALLMDETIKELMEEDFDPDILAAGFVENFAEIAATCWGGTFYSDWAKDLGFGAVE